MSVSFSLNIMLKKKYEKSLLHSMPSNDSCNMYYVRTNTSYTAIPSCTRFGGLFPSIFYTAGKFRSPTELLETSRQHVVKVGGFTLARCPIPSNMPDCEGSLS